MSHGIRSAFSNQPYRILQDELHDWRSGARFWIPEAMVSEEGLRSDIRALARRGFGAIEVVPANFAPQDFSADRAWRSDAWYGALRIVLSEAAACGMRVDLACGMQWPISAPKLASANDLGALYELTWDTVVTDSPAGSPMSLPERRVTHDEGTPVLISACAYREAGEGVLEADSYRDLTAEVEGDAVASPGIGWRVFAFWGQPACQKVRDRFYVIDHLSEAGVDAVVPQWDELFERITPAEAAPLRYVFCDSLEHRVSLDWTPDLPEVFLQLHGYGLLPYLPILSVGSTYPANDAPGWSLDNATLAAAVRRDFCDTLTWCYNERHVRPLAKLAHSHGMRLRYQVSYNKPYCEELAATVTDVPENESLGRPTLDNLRIMAGAAQLTRKERYSFEAACEFGNAYGQTQSDLLWWLGRSWTCGCNYQVFHGVTYGGAYEGPASEDGMIAGFGWPGYETFGRMLSNYWNRTLSEEAMADLTRGIARVNRAASGRHLVDLAVLRRAYLNEGHGKDGSHEVCDKGVLQAAGYTYDFLAPELLGHKNASVADGRLDPEGASYKALVLLPSIALSVDELSHLAELAREGLPVVLVEEKPVPSGRTDALEYETWHAALQTLMMTPGVYEVLGYQGLVDLLASLDILPDARTSEPDVLHAHLKGPEGDCYLVCRTNDVDFEHAKTTDTPDTMMPKLDTVETTRSKVTMTLRGIGDPLLVDPVTGEQTPLVASLVGECVSCTLELALGDVRLIRMDEHVPDSTGLSASGLEGVRLGPWDVVVDEFCPSESRPQLFLDSEWERIAGAEGLADPCWLDELAFVPEGFAGRATFLCSFELDALPTVGMLELPAFADTIEVEINGVCVPCVPRLATPNVVHALRIGQNQLSLTVCTTLRNRLIDGASQRFGIGGPVRLLLG